MSSAIRNIQKRGRVRRGPGSTGKPKGAARTPSTTEAFRGALGRSTKTKWRAEWPSLVDSSDRPVKP